MKIASIALHPWELPLTHPYRVSGGRLLFETLDSTFVRIDTDAGIEGGGDWFCHEMLNVDPIIGGARNNQGATRAPTEPGLRR